MHLPGPHVHQEPRRSYHSLQKLASGYPRALLQLGVDNGVLAHTASGPTRKGLDPAPYHCGGEGPGESLPL